MKYYFGVFLERLKNTTKYINQESQCPGRDSNREPFEYKSGALLSESAWSFPVRNIIETRSVVSEMNARRADTTVPFSVNVVDLVQRKHKCHSAEDRCLRRL
jgi:hypothetical protein